MIHNQLKRIQAVGSIWILSQALFLMSTAAAAGAGGIASGGGAAVVCRDANHQIVHAELLDLYEGKIRYGYSIAYSDIEPAKQLLAAVGRLRFSPFHEAVTTESVAMVQGRFQFLPPGVVLDAPNDTGNGHGVVKPDGCEIDAVGFYEDDGTLRVAQPIYYALSFTDRAAFLVHEAIYRIARESSRHTDSFLARRLTAALFAQNASIADVRKLLQLTYFQETHESFALLKGRDDGYIRVRIIPESRRFKYWYSVRCFNLAGERTGIEHELDNVQGEKTVTVPARDCPRMDIKTTQGPHEPIGGPHPGAPDSGLKFELWSANQVFYVGSNHKPASWINSINIGRYFSIGARIP